MKVYLNEKMIARRARLGRRASFIGLLVLFAGMLASFAPGTIARWTTEGNPTGQAPLAQWLLNGGWLPVSMLCLVIGFLLGQIGNYNARRFMRNPRPDQVVERALKGFDDRNHLYVWSTPGDLVLAGPSGLFTFVTRDLAGAIALVNGRVKQPFSWRRFVAFSQEAPGLPVDDAVQLAGKVSAWLSKELGSAEPLEVQPVVVFTNDKATLTVENAAIPVLHHKQIKEYLRTQLRSSKLSKETLRAAIERLDQEAVRRGATMATEEVVK